MAPRGRKRKAGLKREDAARDRMRDMGFQERVINDSIKELLRVYGEDHWFLIEDGSYDPLLNICLEKQEEISKQLAKIQNEEMAEDQRQVIVREQMADQLAGEEQTIQFPQIQNEEMAEDQNQVIAEEEQPNQLAGEEQAYQLAENQQEQKESETHVEDGRDQADTVSIPSEAVMDPSPAAFQFGDASVDYAPHSVEGAENTNCGWLVEEEEEEEEDEDEDEDDDDGDEDDGGDDDGDDDGDEGDGDDEIIHLTPEPLCKELEELLREVRGQKRRKKGSRWDT